MKADYNNENKQNKSFLFSFCCFAINLIIGKYFAFYFCCLSCDFSHSFNQMKRFPSNKPDASCISITKHKTTQIFMFLQILGAVLKGLIIMNINSQSIFIKSLHSWNCINVLWCDLSWSINASKSIELKKVIHNICISHWIY